MSTPDTGVPEAGGPGAADVVTGDNNVPTPSTRKWKPGVFAINLQPSPSPKIGGDPGFTIPLLQAQNPKAIPKRLPDTGQESKLIVGIGLGCGGYKVTSMNPADPAGPPVDDGDMGTVTFDGFTGGSYLPVDASVPKPMTCTRNELASGLGIFGYQCPQPMPATGFLKQSDMLSVQVSGGADIPAWSAAGPPSQNPDLTVTTDLWSMTPAQLDGSQDLTLEYNCSGGPCNKAGILLVVIQTSDGRDADAAPPNPFDFPPAKKEFGLVQCNDFLNVSQNSFTISKDVLKAIPPTWRDVQIVVGTLIPTNGQIDGQPTTLAAGFARFGVTHRD